jgi:pimeloyl-ACP methyl ester carboxylesterase
VAAVRVPVTVVRGTRDRLCDAGWAASVAAAAPDGRLVELAGAAHMTPHTRPGAVARLLLERYLALAVPASGGPPSGG